MKKQIYIFILSIIIAIFFVINCSTGVQTGAVITFIKGNVYLVSDTKTLTRLVVGDKLEQNYVIKTDKDSFIEIKIGHNSIIRLKEDSIAKFEQLPMTLQEQHTGIVLKKGGLFANPEKIRSGSSFEVETESITVGVRGTKFNVDKTGNGVSKVYVVEGNVKIKKKIIVDPSIDTIKKYSPELRQEILQAIEDEIILNTNSQMEISQKNLKVAEKKINKKIIAISKRLSNTSIANRNEVVKNIKEKDLKEIKDIINNLGTKKAIFVLVKKGTLHTTNMLNKNKTKINKIKIDTFYISRFELTFAEYDKYCDDTGTKKPNDEGWGRGRRPVINVSWYDAVSYCNWKSKNDGLIPYYKINRDGKKDKYDIVHWQVKVNKKSNGYRLPTDVEWEFAARSGNLSDENAKYSGGNSIDKSAWYYGNSYNRTHSVGLKQSNKLGLYDMSGNVWEWVYDSFEQYKIIRGGSWNYEAKYSRVNQKYLTSPSRKDCDVGFRIVRNKR